MSATIEELEDMVSAAGVAMGARVSIIESRVASMEARQAKVEGILLEMQITLVNLLRDIKMMREDMIALKLVTHQILEKVQT